MLKLRNVEAGYGKLKVLRHVSMHVNDGEIVTIIGANGAGKTTLLHTISGLIKPMAGQMEFKKQDIAGMQPEKRVFAGVALVPEGRQVFATMSVHENLVLGGFVRHRKGLSDELAREFQHVYSLFPRLKEREAQLAGTLSGGEQQMLAIARALMSGPKLIMMDEPSMGLAPLIVREIFNVISRLRDEGKTVLLVEQNAKASLKVADRGYVLENGRVILQGPASELLENRDVQRAYLGRDLDSEVSI